MIKVITYGTFDLLHYGHIRLLERAKALGDYLIVGVTADDFDKTRGKINVRQSLMERIEALRMTGIADKIIVEEYEGQKIDDIKRYDADIFTVGSDWTGKFDYLKEYCEVIYLKRTEGVSSSKIRSEKREIRLGLIGESPILNKYRCEADCVNGVKATAVCTYNKNLIKETDKTVAICSSYDELLEACDAVYIVSHPSLHYEHVKKALACGKHVLCESPVAMRQKECDELFSLASSRGLVLMDSIKTAYSTAYNRLLLLLKGGIIGKIFSIDAVCTSLDDVYAWDDERIKKAWNSICAWGPTAMLPIFQIAGEKYLSKVITTYMVNEEQKFDAFTKIDFTYPDMVASLKVGMGVKSEGELIITGTEGYIYVPAPWWKTDYFEVRYENQQDNKRYFYQLDGEGIRYEIVAFLKAIESGKNKTYIEKNVSGMIAKVIEDYETGIDVHMLSLHDGDCMMQQPREREPHMPVSGFEF